VSELWQHVEEEVEQYSPEFRLLLAAIKDVRNEVDDIRSSVQLIEQNAGVFETMMREHASKTDRLSERLDAAMPGGDIEGHRRYHEEIIKRLEFRNQIIRDSLAKVASTGFIAGSLWLAYAAWQYFLSSIHK
jgi:uncharacterized coiled-coil DUF342 family protein